MLIHHLYAAYLAFCNALLRMPGHRFRIMVLRRMVRAEVGERCAIERGVQVMVKSGLRIGDETNVNPALFWTHAAGSA